MFSPRQCNFRRAVSSVYVFWKKRRQQEAFWNTAFNQFVLKLLTPNAPKIYFLYHRTIFFFWKKWEHSPSTIVVRFLFPKLALSLIFFSSEPGFLGVSSVFHLQQKLTQIPTWAAKIEYTGIGTMWLPEPNSIYHISFIIYYFRDSWVKLHEVNTC